MITTKAMNLEDHIEDLPYLQSLAATLAHLARKVEEYGQASQDCHSAAVRTNKVLLGIELRMAERLARRMNRIHALALLIDDELDTAAKWEAEALDPADDESLDGFTAAILDLVNESD